MGLLNFQDGFAQGLTVRGIPLLQAYPGKVFWVNNSSVIPKDGIGGVDGGGTNSRPGTGSYKRPFASIDYAIGRCTASRGDIVAVMPGYTQSLISTDITLDVAGVAVVGLGAGSLRPQLSYGHADGLFTLSAPNSAVSGVGFVAATADVTKAVSVTATALGNSFENCTFTESATADDLNFLSFVILTTLAHDQSFRNCTFIGDDEFDVAMIAGTVHDRLWIEDCRFYQNGLQDTVTALLTGTDITSSVIKNCSFRNNAQSALFIGFSGTCTGLVRNCYFSSVDTAGGQTAGFTSSGMQYFECYTSGDIDGWGLVCGDTAVYS